MQYFNDFKFFHIQVNIERLEVGDVMNKLKLYRMIKYCSIAELTYTVIYLILFSLTMKELDGQPYMGIIPVIEWIDASQFSATISGDYFKLLVAMQIGTCIYVVILMVLVWAIYKLYGNNSKLAKMTILMQFISTVTVMSTYILQFTYIPYLIREQKFILFANYCMYNFESPISLINLSGYMIFGGIASILCGIILENHGLNKITKVIFVFYGLVSLVSITMFIMSNMISLVIWYGGLAIFGWAFIFMMIEYHKQVKAIKK